MQRVGTDMDFKFTGPVLTVALRDREGEEQYDNITNGLVSKTKHYHNFGFSQYKPWMFCGAEAVLRRMETERAQKERIQAANSPKAAAYASDHMLDLQVCCLS